MSDLNGLDSAEEGIENQGAPLEKLKKIIHNAISNDTTEYKSAIYTLEEELLPLLGDPNNNISLENNPRRRYEPGYYHEDIVPSGMQDFAEKVEYEDGYPVEPMAYTQTYKFRMAEGKELRVYNKVFNPAYFPFNTLEAERIENQKKVEVERYDEFRGRKLESSGFDVQIPANAVKESLTLVFQGYIYTFTKMAHHKRDDTYSLKIEQFVSTKDGNRAKEVVRESRSLGIFGMQEFELLKETVINLSNNAQQRLGNKKYR